MAVVPLIASLVFATASNSPHVSLHAAGETVASVLVDLSRQCHIKFKATGAVAKERIIAEFSNAPLSDVKERLARSTLGDWKIAGGTQTLVPAPERWLKRQRAEARTRVNALRAHLDWRSKCLARQGKLDEGKASSMIEGLDRQLKAPKKGEGSNPDQNLAFCTPIERLLTRMLLLLTPRDLELTGDGKEARFSNRPTQFQRPISRQADDAFRAYAADRAVWLAALKKHPKVYESELASAAEGYYGPFGTDTGPIPYAYKWDRTGSPYKVEINIETEAGDLSITLSDRKGIVVENADDLHAGQAERPRKPSIRGVPIQIDAQTRACIKAMTSEPDDFRPPPDPIPPAIRSLFLHPETVEPLSLVASPELKLVARAKREKLLACVPDDLASMAAIASSSIDHPDSSNLLDALSDREVEVRESGGWLEFDLKEPQNRLDRAALGRLLRGVDSDGNVRIGALATYAAGAEGIAHYPYILLNALPTRGFQYECVDWDLEWTALRILGNLNPESAARAKAGGVPIRSLSPLVRRLVHQEFLKNPSLSTKDSKRPSKFESIYEGALDALPLGPDADAWISIEESDEPTIYGGPVTAPFQSSCWQSSSASAVLRGFDLKPDGGSKLLLCKGTSKQVNLNIHYSEKYFQRSLLVDREFIGDAVPANQPTSGFRAYVEHLAQLERLERGQTEPKS